MSDIPAEDVRKLRRMVSETDIDNSPYSDAILRKMIEEASGNLYWVASDICREKSAQATALFDFSADGGSYHRGDISAKWLKLANTYEAKGGKRNGGTIRLIKFPIEPQRINVLDDRTEWDA